MGSPDTDANAEFKEKPQHTVTLSPFLIGKYQVTQAQWRAVMGDNPSVHTGCDNCPVEHVTYNTALQFITKLNRTTGLNYRFPTEAEWEYACRAGTTTRFYWGDDITNSTNYVYYSGSTTQTVGLLLPNAWGLYDMGSNVFEWCQDVYNETYYSISPVNNPVSTSGSAAMVMRGNTYKYSNVWVSRSAQRMSAMLSYSDGCLGFRLARSN